MEHIVNSPLPTGRGSVETKGRHSCRPTAPRACFGSSSWWWFWISPPPQYPRLKTILTDNESYQDMGRFQKMSDFGILKKFKIFMCIFCCKHVHSKDWFINCIKEQKIKKQTTSFRRYGWFYIGWPKSLSLVLPQQNQN